MALTEQQKRIVFHMKMHDMTVDEMRAVLFHLEKDFQQRDMVTYLLSHPKDTPIEVVDKAVELGKKEKDRDRC